jgi:hypothetical protein
MIGPFILAVDGNNQVVRHDVQTGGIIDHRQVITEGLSGNERLIISGLQRVRPGIVVDAEQAAPITATTPAQTDQSDGRQPRAGSTDDSSQSAPAVQTAGQ